ncbi:MAG TPA: hypothetical protein VL625_04405 [Patescibacteria group bacterium]|nr:hypothetical protein [Patescibacteria group bacterium]
MTEFRGVAKESLISSFTRAQNFLRDQNLGEATAEALKRIDRADAVTKITTAKDDKDLALQLRRTGVLPLLSHFGKVFETHAACESAEGKGHEMQDLYRDLSSWGAFFDETAPIDPQLDKEAGAHVIMRISSHIAGADATALREGELDTTVNALKDKNPVLSEWLEQVVPIYRLFGEAGDIASVNEMMQGTSTMQDSTVQGTLTGISGLQTEQALAPGRAMRPYKATVSNQIGAQTLSGEEWIIHLLEIRKSVLKAMLPFFETGQFGKIDMLPASPEKDKYNISFYATAPAAGIAAAQFHAFECVLRDEKGAVVEPAISSPPPPLAPGANGKQPPSP